MTGKRSTVQICYRSPQPPQKGGFFLYMLLASVDVDGTEWSRGTEVFACTATEALVGIDGRNHDSGRQVGIGVFIPGNHKDSFGRAMTCTVATRHTVAIGQAVVGHNDGITYMNICLLFGSDTMDGSSRTDLAAACAFRTAPAALVRHLRLQKRLQFVGWAQHPVGAFTHT